MSGWMKLQISLTITTERLEFHVNVVLNSVHYGVKLINTVRVTNYDVMCTSSAI